MTTTKLTPGDVIQKDTKPDTEACYFYTQPDGKLAVRVMGTYVYDEIWSIEGVSVVKPVNEQSFNWAVTNNPRYRKWSKQNGRKPSFDEASTLFDERGLLRVEDIPSAPAPSIVYECLECGANYSTPGQVEPGGMGCVRCNH